MRRKKRRRRVAKDSSKQADDGKLEDRPPRSLGLGR